MRVWATIWPTTQQVNAALKKNMLAKRWLGPGLTLKYEVLFWTPKRNEKEMLIGFKTPQKWAKSFRTWQVAGSHAGWLNPDFCLFVCPEMFRAFRVCSLNVLKLPNYHGNPQPFMVWNPSFLLFGVQRYFSNSVIWFTTTWNSSEYQKLFNIDSIDGNI